MLLQARGRMQGRAWKAVVSRVSCRGVLRRRFHGKIPKAVALATERKGEEPPPFVRHARSSSYAVKDLRRLNETKPINAEPNSQIAAGIGVVTVRL